MKKYSILTFNFNNYEIMREPEEIDPECEYIYVTDDEKYKNQTKVWNVIIDKDLDGLSPFDKCFKVRYNLFKYATTDVCIFMDGSIQIHKSLKKLYEDFMASGADLGLNIHPERNNVYDEYLIWMQARNYPKEQFEKCMTLFKAANYNPKYKGLYQATMRICKNTDLNKQIDEMVYDTLLEVSKPNKTIDRLDQTIYSFVLNKFFEGEIKVFPFAQQVFQNKYLTWFYHNTNKQIKYNLCNDKLEDYCQNKLVKLYKLK